jgi:hypothetical protein
MNNKLKFLEIMLSDLVSHRDTMEMELNRVLNDETPPIIQRKIDFDKLLGDITMTNNKIKTLSEYMGTLMAPELNNNND